MRLYEAVDLRRKYIETLRPSDMPAAPFARSRRGPEGPEVQGRNVSKRITRIGGQHPVALSRTPPLREPYRSAAADNTEGIYPEQALDNVQKTLRRPEIGYQYEQLLLTMTLI